MSLFTPVTNDQAFLKCGFFGRQGAGKTYTASQMVIGLHKYLKKQGLPEGDNPVLMMDTETGRSWVRGMFAEEGIELEASNVRAFRSLVPAMAEAEERKCILLIDSLSHYWAELMQSYLRKKGRNRLVFSDWNYLKGPEGNGAFAEMYVNCSAHVVWCARASFEYDFHENEAGQKELETTGIKPRAESEAGYEPNLLVLMTRYQDFDPAKPENTTTIHYGSVLKDRSNRIDGKVFKNPTFKHFLPHVQALALGGEHAGTDTSMTSEASIPPDSGEGRLRREQREICLDEIQELLVKHHPGRSADALKTKGDLLEQFLGSRSWERIKTFPFERLAEAREGLWVHLEQKSYQIGGQDVDAED